MAKSKWSTVVLHPTTGLDTRSRPAGLPPGFFREKINLECTSDMKLCRRAGFDKFYADAETYTNYDHHFQNGTREPFTFLLETTDSSGVRRLYDGSQSRVSTLNESAGTWFPIITGASGGQWRGGVLQEQLIISNGVDDVYSHHLPNISGSASTIPDLVGLGIKAAKVVVTFNGFAIIMNMIQAGQRHDTRVRWSDLNLPLSWAVGGSSLAEYNDLDYGDEILAAAPLYGSLYIFTRRSIWRANVSTDPSSTFSFTKVYTEPQTQTGCLTYPRTLVSDGQQFYYLSKEAVYTFSPFVAAPVRDDWLYKATGVIFSKADTAMTGEDCNAPVAAYVPANKEYWVSWPSASSTLNNYTLIAQTEAKTADIKPQGFTALINFRRTPTENNCQERQDLIGASSQDYALKSMGGVFFEEFLVLPDPTDPSVDIPIDQAIYIEAGYYSEMRGMIPLGLTDRPKHVRSIIADLDIIEEDIPKQLKLRIGNSRMLEDPVNADDRCQVQWNDVGVQKLTCPDALTNSAMKAKGLRPGLDISWQTYATGIYLYFHFKIQNADGSAPIGADICFDAINFDAMASAKP